MNYVEFCQKKYKNYGVIDLLDISLKFEKLKRLGNSGEVMFAENNLDAINLILKSKDFKFIEAFKKLKKVLYEQKRIY